MKYSNLKNAAVEAFCRRYKVLKLSLFGSSARGEAKEDSDVDILVEFQPGVRVGFLRLAVMEAELTKIVGQKVDLRTPAELSRFFIDDVLAEAKALYAEG